MDFDNSFLDSVLEGAEEAIDMTLDTVQEQDTEIEETITTDVDDVEIDSIIGDDGKGSSALISDDDIEKIDSGKDPDFDTVDADAAKGAKDKEINDLEKDIEDGSIITKNEIKDLKEGQELLDFVGSVVSEDFELPSTGEENIAEHECGVLMLMNYSLTMMIWIWMMTMKFLQFQLLLNTIQKMIMNQQVQFNH